MGPYSGIAIDSVRLPENLSIMVRWKAMEDTEIHHPAAVSGIDLPR
jgi:hypothetical protein